MLIDHDTWNRPFVDLSSYIFARNATTTQLAGATVRQYYDQKTPTF